MLEPGKYRIVKEGTQARPVVRHQVVSTVGFEPSARCRGSAARRAGLLLVPAPGVRAGAARRPVGARGRLARAEAAAGWWWPHRRFVLGASARPSCTWSGPTDVAGATLPGIRRLPGWRIHPTRGCLSD